MEPTILIDEQDKRDVSVFIFTRFQLNALLQHAALIAHVYQINQQQSWAQAAVSGAKDAIEGIEAEISAAYYGAAPASPSAAYLDNDLLAEIAGDLRDCPNLDPRAIWNFHLS